MASAYPKFLKDPIESGEYIYQSKFSMPTRLAYSGNVCRVELLYRKKINLLLVSRLICGNAAGDYKNKALLVYKSENPQAPKRISKNSLPAYWKSNKKAWMTGKIFEDWFLNYFCVEAENYCKRENIAFKILLILDNAPSHPAYLADLHPNVKVIFLPPNTTSLIPRCHRCI